MLRKPLAWEAPKFEIYCYYGLNMIWVSPKDWNLIPTVKLRR
jgi:hypothetical protein